MWSPFARVDSLRSDRNWGVGDFTDLMELCKQSFDSGGAAAVAVDPLQPIFEQTDECSPIKYLALSFIDPVYIDVETVEDLREQEDVKRQVLSPEFQQKLEPLRNSARTKFAEVRACKLEILTLLYQHFRHEHLRTQSDRCDRFRTFQAETGSKLRSFAVYEALAEHFAQRGWTQWADGYQRPDSDEVKAFEESNAERVEFFQYLQWLADVQLHSVRALCYSAQPTLGLCRTVAMTPHCDGFETWLRRARPESGKNKENFAGLYEPFVRSLRATMRCSSLVYLPILDSLDSTYLECFAARAVDDFDWNKLLAVIKRLSNDMRCGVIASGFGTFDHKLPFSAEHVYERHGLFPARTAFAPEREVFGSDQNASDWPCAFLPIAGPYHSLVSYWLGADVAATAGDDAESKTIRDSAVAQRVLERVDVLSMLEKAALFLITLPSTRLLHLF